jgi:hypothetical protein
MSIEHGPPDEDEENWWLDREEVLVKLNGHLNSDSFITEDMRGWEIMGHIQSYPETLHLNGYKKPEALLAALGLVAFSGR